MFDRDVSSRRSMTIRVLTAGILIGTAGSLLACSVPVCRYALERWQADLFDVVIFHDAPLTKDQTDIVDSLRPDEDGKKPANVHVTYVNVNDDIAPLFQPMWEASQKESLPRMAVRYPDPRIAPAGIWSGDVSKTSVDTMLNSKVRRLVGEELVKGTSAVWVMLESGDAKKDAAAEKRIQSRLDHLEKTLEISKPDAQDIEEGLVAIDPDKLELSFRMFRLSRTDPAESFFVDLLLHTEPDLKDEEFANQPIAFPIFGRGRCLYALIGDGIDNDNIDEACQFLAGPCSCQVKNQNPGVDLLMTTDWDSLVNSTIEIDTSLPPLIGLQGFKDPDDENEEPIIATETGELIETNAIMPETQSDADTTLADNAPATTHRLPEPVSPGIKPIQATSVSATTAEPGVSVLMRNLVMLAMGAAVGVILFSIIVVRRQS